MRTLVIYQVIYFILNLQCCCRDLVPTRPRKALCIANFHIFVAKASVKICDKMQQNVPTANFVEKKVTQSSSNRQECSWGFPRSTAAILHHGRPVKSSTTPPQLHPAGICDRRKLMMLKTSFIHRNVIRQKRSNISSKMGIEQFNSHSHNPRITTTQITYLPNYSFTKLAQSVIDMGVGRWYQYLLQNCFVKTSVDSCIVLFS